MKIGEKIKLVRKQRKFTQEIIANALGVQRAAISKYEKGIVSPSWETITKIAEVLNITTAELLADVDALSYDSELKESVESAMQLMVEQLGTNDSLSDTMQEMFSKLNTLGKSVAVDVVEYLTTKEKYTTPDEE